MGCSMLPSRAMNWAPAGSARPTRQLLAPMAAGVPVVHDGGGLRELPFPWLRCLGSVFGIKGSTFRMDVLATGVAGLYLPARNIRKHPARMPRSHGPFFASSRVATSWCARFTVHVGHGSGGDGSWFSLKIRTWPKPHYLQK